MKATAVILAAGQGTRMRSALPKVLHPLGGKPLLQYSLDLAAQIGSSSPVVVVGHGAEQVRETVGDTARFAVQEKQLGTANAVQAAEKVAAGEAGLVVVISADMPLLRSETLQELVNRQMRKRWTDQYVDRHFGQPPRLWAHCARRRRQRGCHCRGSTGHARAVGDP